LFCSTNNKSGCAVGGRLPVVGVDEDLLDIIAEETEEIRLAWLERLTTDSELREETTTRLDIVELIAREEFGLDEAITRLDFALEMGVRLTALDMAEDRLLDEPWPTDPPPQEAQSATKVQTLSCFIAEAGKVIRENPDVNCIILLHIEKAFSS
jgi:hypothetical protein